ncbi:SAM-dependent methyltransferase [Bacillus atrophaeus]|uniref:class I SAM-dependent methyltransferase n=1 Tax=Bacillus atrophaeus TaxID=1452 RepID=UPI000D077838|nr:class I SAM-dependent methyltransferase [Bacillus atrophaeus]MBJ7897336.1 class I SAM-dependent methyltransferase [Bacillus atrophaeus]MBU5262639.1 class I SAM-dependent methyltransferase [Bacillus atrophaeus]MCY8858798.1 class I SAM-dependent methyltransferase [Bacillus atrophaeus]PSA92697.1 SAM-dependent methyltransferase [Bacillus atrophaeus]
MQNDHVGAVYELLDEAAQMIAKELQISYIEALAEAGEMYFLETTDQFSIPAEKAEPLKALLAKAEFNKYEHEWVRKAFQLAILKGLKDKSHPNRQMTPDTIGLFISYLVNKFTEGKKDMTILDPAAGTGNLLLTVLNQQSEQIAKSYGIEIDDVLLKIAYAQANLQEKEIELFHQDSLEPVFVDPVDTVICDLPVGFYPNDEGAKAYELKADEGHSFAHHLFIEQSVKHTKPGGYLFFMIPNHLFDSTQSDKLKRFFSEKVHLNALLQLPQSLFKDEAHAKSILVLQKQGDQTKPPKQMLLANLPSFANQPAMLEMMAKLDTWFQEEK